MAPDTESGRFHQGAFQVTLPNFAKTPRIGLMGTMNISLPDSLREFVDEQVAQSGYGTSSEYVRELIRRGRGGTLLCGSRSRSRGAVHRRNGSRGSPHALHPLSGPPRYASELDIPVLRTWSMKGFLYFVCYVVHDQVDV